MEVQSHNHTYEIKIGNKMKKLNTEKRVANLQVIYIVYIGGGSD